MPTGYTADILTKEVSFAEFALTCARNFGACIMLRDEPLSAEIPKFKPSDHSAKALAAAEKELARLSAMTPKEQAEFGEAAKKKKLSDSHRYLENKKAENAKFEAMLKKVNAWTPPTKDHQGLKQFMGDQLRISMSTLDYWQNEIKEAESKSPLEYYAAAVESEKWNVDYHTKENQAEIERTDSRNRWVDALKKSLSIKS